MSNAGDGIMVSDIKNLIPKNDIGDKGKSNGGNGITVAGAGNGKKSPVEIEQNTGAYNAKVGIKVSCSQHQLKNNSAQNNGGCEYDLTPKNIDSGGNKSNGSSVALVFPSCV